MTGIPVVLDVDTGVDDSLALLLAACSPALNLLGATCVTGNVAVDKVVDNTLKVLAVAGRGDVPVAIGRNQPLLEKVVSAAYVHGEDGLGGLNASLPVPARPGSNPRTRPCGGFPLNKDRDHGLHGRGRGLSEPASPVLSP